MYESDCIMNQDVVKASKTPLERLLESKVGDLNAVIPPLLNEHSQAAIADILSDDDLTISTSFISRWLRENSYVYKSKWVRVDGKGNELAALMDKADKYHHAMMDLLEKHRQALLDDDLDTAHGIWDEYNRLEADDLDNIRQMKALVTAGVS